jgi:hypothetical protein
MSQKIQMKRGAKANLPTLSVGEPAFTTDTEEFYVGSDSGNIGFAKQLDLDNLTVVVNSIQPSDSAYETAGGTGTVITLTFGTLTNGYNRTFIASASNGGVATTINGKPLYKPNTVLAPNLILGKAYTVWYNLSGDNFFIKASTEGTAVIANVLAGKTFSNDDDTGLVGTMSSKTAQTYNPSTAVQTIATNQYLSGAQTIAATTGTATTAQVLAGSTFNSANGIGLTGIMATHEQEACISTGLNAVGTVYLKPAQGYWSGDANCWVYAYDANFIASNIPSGKSIFGVTGSLTIASLGGKRYATGTFNYVTSTAATFTLPFTARFIYMTSSAVSGGHYSYPSISGVFWAGSGSVANITCTSTTITATSGFYPANATITYEIWE